MKRILILANNDVGLYKFRKELIQELLNRGNEIFVSLPQGDLVQRLVDMGCQYIDTEIDRRGVDPRKDFKVLIAYYKILKAVQPELVITYTIKPNVYGGIICRWFSVPYVANITGLGTTFQTDNLMKRLVVCMYKIALKKARTVFFENEGNKEVFLHERITEEDKTCVLNGAGVNLAEYSFCEYPGDESMRFLFVGRVMKEKGVDELFAVAKRIKSEYKNVYFDIVGPMEDDYSTIVDELVGNGVIEYHGYQEDVKPFIEKCHCFVLPSYHEGMANTNLESASMGRPVITSNTYGCKEAVEEGVTGLLCARKSADDLFRVLKEFCSLSYEVRRNMGVAGRVRMERLFDKKNIVKNTMERMIE